MLSVKSRIGVYRRPRNLSNMDGHSREARILRRARFELTAHVGGKPSAMQRMQIEADRHPGAAR